MGLSSFNRMRREKADVERIEAERFKRDNEARQQRQADRLAVHDENEAEVDAIREAEHEATLRIGAKVEEGMKEGVLDEPLRRDHAAEIAGRNIEGVQTPKDPVERVGERIPEGGTANEDLVPHTPVENEGPTAEQVEAAAKEVGALPAAADGEENVAPQGETVDGDGSGTALSEAETDDEGNHIGGEKATRDAVQIPSDWETAHWRTRVALAEKISGLSDLKADDANGIISAEVERRKAAE